MEAARAFTWNDTVAIYKKMLMIGSKTRPVNF